MLLFKEGKLLLFQEKEAELWE